MLTLRSKLVVVSNSTTTMGISKSPKSQLIKESSPFNAPLILVVEVKSDTLAAKISDIEATLPCMTANQLLVLLTLIPNDKCLMWLKFQTRKNS